jgi:DNA-binding response OmpR family regulator
VLIVDDNVDAANMLAMLLQMDGHATEIAHDGESAVERALATSPEVILLDLGEPPTAFQIQSKRVADSFRAFFDTKWKTAKE